MVESVMNAMETYQYVIEEGEEKRRRNTARGSGDSEEKNETWVMTRRMAGFYEQRRHVRDEEKRK